MKQLTPYQIELLDSALRAYEATARQEGKDLLAAEAQHLHLQIVNAATVDLDAAAPDMLAALKANRRCRSKHSTITAIPDTLWHQIDAAIAKAEGRS